MLHRLAKNRQYELRLLDDDLSRISLLVVFGL